MSAISSPVTPPTLPQYPPNDPLNTFTHESQALSRGMTPPTLSLPTSQAASTGRDPALRPYWNARVAAWSRRCVLLFLFLSVYFIAWRCSRSLYLGLETYINELFGVQVVVAHRDRLCHFAFDLIKHVLCLNTKIIEVHSNDDSLSSTSAANELAQDILAINTVFICRMQGQCSAEN